MLYIVIINSLYNFFVCKSKYFNRSLCIFINGIFIIEIVVNIRFVFFIFCFVFIR